MPNRLAEIACLMLLGRPRHTLASAPPFTHNPNTAQPTSARTPGGLVKAISSLRKQGKSLLGRPPDIPTGDADFEVFAINVYAVPGQWLPRRRRLRAHLSFPRKQEPKPKSPSRASASPGSFVLLPLPRLSPLWKRGFFGLPLTLTLSRQGRGDVVWPLPAVGETPVVLPAQAAVQITLGGACPQTKNPMAKQGQNF